MLHSWLPRVCLTALAISIAKAALVTTSNGTVQGNRCPSTDSNYFLGIPFADPPVGDFRFQAPRPYSGSYSGTLKGMLPAPICHQFGTAAAVEKESEDCLYLNVYAPANATASSALPVKIWIYGGAFVTGASTLPMYDGCFASEDAIIVTINYRLGPLGYLGLKNTTLLGNYGVQDQLQAIAWMDDNIAAFGGDADKILLFGQSAGAISSFVLATLPEIKSLIKAVVMESGGGVDLATMSSAQPFQEDFVHKLGCTTADVECLRSKTPAQLNATYHETLTKADELAFAYTLFDRDGAGFGWGPLAESQLFPVQPSQVGIQVPAIFGSNGLEGSIFVLQTFGAGSRNLTTKDYTDFIAVNFGPFAPSVSKQYPLSLFDGDVFEAISILVRDYLFRCTASRGLGRTVAKNIGAWTYSFNQTLSCPFAEGVPPDFLQMLGATHGAEIDFAFGEVDNLPLPNGNCSLSAGEKNISTYIQQSWTGMARAADPGTEWPAFVPNSSLGINFQDGVITPGVVDYSMCGFWDNLQSALLAATQTANSTTSTSGTASIVPPSTGGAVGIRAGLTILALSAAVSLVLGLL